MELTRGSLADLLGRPVVDETGQRLGRVREVEVRGENGAEPAVVALLVGRAALRARLWNRAAEGASRVAWNDVLRIDKAGALVVRSRAGGV